MQQIWIVALVLALYGILEFAWLTSMSGFYQRHLKVLQPSWSGRMDLWAAVLCYALLAFVIYWFVIRMFSVDRSFYKGLFSSALFGLTIYGVFNLTNKSTLDRYGWNVVLIDSAWGMFVMAVIYAWARYLAKKT